MFDWDRAFASTKVNETAFILKETILNILSNFMPPETLTAEDKDPIVYKTHFFQEKSHVYKSFLNSKNRNNSQYLRRLKILQEDLNITSEIIFPKSNLA